MNYIDTDQVGVSRFQELVNQVVNDYARSFHLTAGCGVGWIYYQESDSILLRKGDVRFFMEGEKVPAGYVIATPQGFRGDLTREQFRSRAHEIMRRLPIL